jgi:hypothetical protein
MAEDGAQAAVPVTVETAAAPSHGYSTQSDVPMPPLAQQESPMSPRIHTPNPFSRHNSSLDLDDYFVSHGSPSCAATLSIPNAGTSRKAHATSNGTPNGLYS